jgi:CheY-like chemotaxis protein
VLRQKPELEVIGELSDGLAAVLKAEELKPDLILLDIGLPTLNGIEAARQIRRLAPKAKIIFLTQESSDAVVQEALSLGARGYVVKAWAGSELLPAVKAVLQDKQFVSGGVTGQDSVEGPVRSHSPEVQPLELPSGRRKTKVFRQHEVLFYRDDACFLERFSGFIETALKAGNAAIVVVTESHRVSLLQKLRAHDVDVAAAVEGGRYISLGVEEMLSAIMVDDMPDPIRFVKVAGDLISTATKTANGKHRRVSACGECAPGLWAKGMAEAAIRLEELWDKVAKAYDVDILCGYPVNGFHQDENSQTFQRICAKHSTVYQDENAT